MAIRFEYPSFEIKQAISPKNAVTLLSFSSETTGISSSASRYSYTSKPKISACSLKRSISGCSSKICPVIRLAMCFALTMIGTAQSSSPYF